MGLKYRNEELNAMLYLLSKREPRLNRRVSQERLNKVLPLQVVNPTTKTTYLLSDEEAELAFRYPKEFAPFKKRNL